MKLNYCLDGKVMTEIDVDMKKQTVQIKNHTDVLLDRAFGINEHPTYEDFLAFCEDRGIPQSRFGFQSEMRLRGIKDTSPLGIMLFYNGRISDDEFYVELVEDDYDR